MTAYALLNDLRQRGVVLTAKGDRLAYDAPRGVLTADLRALLVGLKPALLAILRGDPPPRVRAGRAIRHARQAGDNVLAVALRDAWEERLAVCTIDGGLPEEQAQRIAADEIENRA
ncbi:MAG: hypothetical protein IT442_13325 [Phycisphaeraceae bacterium]|nr:hypothetical protein [Phycisphaeraceae bacterium]